MRRLFIGCAITVLLGTTFVARGSEPNLGSFSDPNGAVTWTGSTFGPVVTAGDPSQCNALGYAAGVCDRFSVSLELPDGYWTAHPGSVEFAIRWDEKDSTERDLDLFVQDAQGNEVARSAGEDSEAEVAFAHGLANGVYDVYVVVVSSPDTPIDYEGRIEVESDAVLDPAGTGHDLLPDLVSIPTKTLRMATGEYLVNPVENPALSCYPEESADTDKNGGITTRCLRFDQIVANLGAGPLELRFNPTDDAQSPPMVQRIYRSDGSSRDRFAGTGEFHPIHAHWHFTGFGYARLLDTGAHVVVEGRKRGFCLIDVEFAMWAQHGNDARTTSFPGCQVPDASGTIVEGIGRGWADNYNWFLADQYLDVTGVADGVYELQVIANPSAFAPTAGSPGIQESDVSNNTSHNWICMHGSDAAIIAGPSAPCV